MKNQILYFAGAIAAVIGIGYLIGTKEDNQDDKDTENASKFFSLKNFTSVQSVLTLYHKLSYRPTGSWELLTRRIGQANALRYAKDIYDSKNLFDDDESKLYSVFREIKYKSDLLFIQVAFTARINAMPTIAQPSEKNIIDFIASFTNDKERAEIWAIMKKKPDFPPFK